MKILKYGKFLNSSPNYGAYDWDYMPIGMQSAINHSNQLNYKSAHNEYYYKDENDRIHIVKDAKPILKLFALIRIRNPRKIVGYVDSSIIDESKNEMEIQ